MTCDIINSDTTHWTDTYSAIIEAGTTSSTRRAYTRDIAYFWHWADLALGQSKHYPVTEQTVIRFVLDHLGHMSPALEKKLMDKKYKRTQGALKIPTLRRYLASLSIAHQETGVESPTFSPKVKILFRRARRSHADNRANKKRNNQINSGSPAGQL